MDVTTLGAALALMQKKLDGLDNAALAERVEAAIQTANAASDNAAAKAAVANTAAGEANTAATNADTAARSANEAAANIETKVSAISNMDKMKRTFAWEKGGIDVNGNGQKTPGSNTARTAEIISFEKGESLIFETSELLQPTCWLWLYDASGIYLHKGIPLQAGSSNLFTEKSYIMATIDTPASNSDFVNAAKDSIFTMSYCPIVKKINDNSRDIENCKENIRDEKTKSLYPYAILDASGKEILSVDAAGEIQFGVIPEQISQEFSRMSFSIIGDSYSTFPKWIPEGYKSYYPIEGNDLTKVEQTWWHQVSKKTGMKICVNSSYSGSCMCNCHPDLPDSTSFISRMKNDVGEGRAMYEKPDIIFIEGGINDGNAWPEAGDIKKDGWTEDDLRKFRPALCYMLDYLKTWNPTARIIVIIYNSVFESIRESQVIVAREYGVEVLPISSVETVAGHPTALGAQSFADQVISYLRR